MFGGTNPQGYFDNVFITRIDKDGALTSPAIADAAATALFVAGPKGWSGVARAMGIKEVMLIDENMTVYMTPEMAQRIQFTVEPKPKIVVTPL